MREELSKSSLKYKYIVELYPNAKKVEVRYIEGGYYDKSRTEYLVDNKVIPEYTEIGNYS